MGVELAFHELTTTLQRLRHALTEMGTVIDDEPPRGKAPRPHLAPQLSDAVQDVLGWVHEAATVAEQGWTSLKTQPDLHLARRTLIASQETLQKITDRWHTEVASDERRGKLRDLLTVRRGEWKLWAQAVHESYPIVEQRLAGVQQAQLRCWQELAERAGQTNVTIHNTNIGKHVSSV